MNASLVFDGRNDVLLPVSMGVPCNDQFQGTPLERLCETACRVCYQSYGYDEQGKRRGRSSEKLHEHIKEVRNHSVYEHATITVRFNTTMPASVAIACLNRKGIWIEFNGEDVEITANLRSILEWKRHSTKTNHAGGYGAMVGDVLGQYAGRLAPMIAGNLNTTHGDLIGVSLKTTNLSDDQAHVSLWLYGSRGFCNEQVRHRFAISQRSTRYVDEDGSPYIEHPLVTKFLSDPTVYKSDRGSAQELIADSIDADRKTYRLLADLLESYNVRNGLDRQTARKQARGAARGYLGNALASEMIFTTSVAGWKWILSQRKSKFADAEIRQVYTPALDALKSSQYGDRFAEFTTVPSPDGLGTVLA